MLLITEEVVERVLSPDDAFQAVESTFVAMSAGKARNFPVVRESLDGKNALFGFKSGYNAESRALGVKAGGYWQSNSFRGLSNHQSTVVVFDVETGRPRALVAGNLLTALRTAAAAAISIRYLARGDARVLGILGAGHQAPYQLRAALTQRPIERVVAWNRTPDKLRRLAEVAVQAGVVFEAVALDRLGAEADVIITISSSFEPLLMADQVRPGTHIACMGSDTRGKQEVEAEVFREAVVFTDEVEQSVTLGEAQHAVASGTLNRGRIIEIGDLIGGLHPGRSSDADVTVFDGTGVGLQDIAVAAVAIDLAVAAGLAVEIDF